MKLYITCTPDMANNALKDYKNKKVNIISKTDKFTSCLRYRHDVWCLMKGNTVIFYLQPKDVNIISHHSEVNIFLNL